MTRKKSKPVPNTLKKMRPSKYNPRQIDELSADALSASLESFGDISGIVFNRRTGNLVTGHQRRQALLKQYGDLTLKNGALVASDGSTFALRVVDWDIQKEKAANIAANSRLLSGEFTAEARNVLADLGLSELLESLRFDELKSELPLLLSDVKFPEIDDSIADSVKKVTCPKCQHEFAI